MHVDDPDPLEQLDPSARRAPHRARLAVGGAVVCFLLAVAVAALFSAGGDDRGLIGADGEPGATSGVAVEPSSGAGTVLVHVLGAVARPGIVELDEGARVVDAIAAAGGLAAEADASGVNLARPVSDGEQLAVPVIGEPPAGSTGANAGGGGAAASDGLVHLNTAGVTELDTLPRIGPAIAQRIIDWRDANGPFTSVEQLREITGIGETTFAGLVDLVAL